MSDELDDLLDDLEGSEPSVPAVTLPVVPPPPGLGSEEVIKVPEQVAKVLTQVLERGESLGEKVNPSPSRASRSKRPKVERGDGKCTAYSPAGTKCKLCGKVHPF